MIVLEYKVKGKKHQYKAIDEAIRTTQFVRNKALRYWMDADHELYIDRFALNKYSTELRNEFKFVKDLNSMAVQSAAERRWSAVRLVRRANGYYCQFCVDVECSDIQPLSGPALGLDVGLENFYTDSNGHHEPNPKFLRGNEQALIHAQRRIYKKVKGSSGRRKARARYSRKHLRISRQRNEHAKRLARNVCKFNDLVAYENLQVRNLLKNHCLAKSISDVSWYLFRQWIEYFAGKLSLPLL